MSSPIIEGFYIDELNESKIDSHALSVEQIIQVIENAYVILPNRKNRKGLYLVIGRDQLGICIAIPIEPTNEPTIWRPITAWPCKESENYILKRRCK
jgi:hypothetical protein